jgi:hypothetical protein
MSLDTVLAGMVGAEHEALRLLVEGYITDQILYRTGVAPERLRLLAATARRPARHTCPQQQCGKPQAGPGHPRKGWVKVKVAGDPTCLWFCCWGCVAVHARIRGAA